MAAILFLASPLLILQPNNSLPDYAAHELHGESDHADVLRAVKSDARLDEEERKLVPSPSLSYMFPTYDYSLHMPWRDLERSRVYRDAVSRPSSCVVMNQSIRRDGA